MKPQKQKSEEINPQVTKVGEILKAVILPEGISKDEVNRVVDYFMATGIIDDILAQAVAEERKRNKITGDTSDGYHTFNELYEFRKVFNAVLFNEWYAQEKYSVHKSKKHADGELCFGGGWFIVMATLPTGQISNHYEMKDWDLFKCEERERADTWDGHEAKDVIDRLLHIINDHD